MTSPLTVLSPPSQDEPAGTPRDVDSVEHDQRCAAEAGLGGAVDNDGARWRPVRATVGPSSAGPIPGSRKWIVFGVESTPVICCCARALKSPIARSPLATSMASRKRQGRARGIVPVVGGVDDKRRRQAPFFEKLPFQSLAIAAAATGQREETTPRHGSSPFVSFERESHVPRRPVGERDALPPVAWGVASRTPPELIARTGWGETGRRDFLPRLPRGTRGGRPCPRPHSSPCS